MGSFKGKGVIQYACGCRVTFSMWVSFRVDGIELSMGGGWGECWGGFGTKQRGASVYYGGVCVRGGCRPW